MNKIILLGNMTRNPKTTRKTAEDGSEVVITKFDLAVNRRSKRDGEADADFFHCTSFGRQAEFVERYFHSGSRVLVIGRVQNNNYTTKEGNRKQNSSTAFWRNLLLTITKRLTEWKDRLVRTS